MRIGFIIPTYNRAHLISETIFSVINQPYDQKEIIVVNDGSKDNLDEVIKKRCKNLKYISYKNNKGQNLPEILVLSLLMQKL